MRRNTSFFIKKKEKCFCIIRKKLPRLPRAVHVVVHVVLLPGSTASSLATRLKYVFFQIVVEKYQCKMKWGQKYTHDEQVQVFKGLDLWPRHHHRHRVIITMEHYHHHIMYLWDRAGHRGRCFPLLSHHVRPGCVLLADLLFCNNY